MICVGDSESLECFYSEEIDSDSENIIEYDNDNGIELDKNTWLSIVKEGWDHIKKIRVKNQEFTTPLLKIFLSSYKHNGLYELSLTKWSITEEHIKSFISSTALTNLKKLDLSNNPLDMTGLLYLANAPYLKNLEILILDNALKGEPTHDIEFYPSYLKKLKALSLANNNLHDKLQWFIDLGLFSHSASEWSQEHTFPVETNRLKMLNLTKWKLRNSDIDQLMK